MAKLGGYKLIDFGGVDIFTSKTISGIYNEIEKTEKRIVGCNLRFGNVYFKELALDVKKDGTNFVLSNSIIKVTITNANVVNGEYSNESIIYDDVDDFKIGIGDIGGNVACIFNETNSQDWTDIGYVNEDGNTSLSSHEEILSLADFTDGIYYMVINFKLRLAVVYGGIAK